MELNGMGPFWRVIVRGAASSRSTYLAMTSTSRLTRVPAFASRRFVTCRVYGMSATEKAPSSIPHTVSEMPSTETEPFSTR